MRVRPRSAAKSAAGELGGGRIGERRQGELGGGRIGERRQGSSIIIGSPGIDA
ncbi:hypothetical protein [Microbacterium sp. 179-I 3D3 NHS]|uniref:hypothetical protein n=1 Tax=Microbacterium sp. 179-I 3D3 NHS TaxID=3142382 RepID=UPI0039A06662